MQLAHTHFGSAGDAPFSTSSSAVSANLCFSSTRKCRFRLLNVFAMRHVENQSSIKPPHSSAVWRLLNLEVPAEKDPGKDDYSVSPPLLDAISSALGCQDCNLPDSALSVVRKSFDARKVVNKNTKDPRFVYAVDFHVDKVENMSPRVRSIIQHLQDRPGKLEFLCGSMNTVDVSALVDDSKCALLERKRKSAQDNSSNVKPHTAKKVTIVGSGPAGLFAALVLAESGAEVTLLERGQPVESRGRDIGRLMVGRMLHPDSNFCYGEGGAGTWSDGKLTTRIGRNSETVRTVLVTLVKFGAPPSILIDGKPHIGTDKLIHILRKVRSHLQSLGVQIRFGTKMVDLIMKGERVLGVKVTSSSLGLDLEVMISDAVMLAVSHSARDVYSTLLEHGIHLSPKQFAVGFRVEHPQELINEIQIVPTSTNPAELCINGMSFSRRSSKWANAALVMTVSSSDLDHLVIKHGPLAGVAFQKELEKKAAAMGGGNMVVPVQTVPDFLDDRLSGGVLPSSSYRLGVKEAALHAMFPPGQTNVLKQALVDFNKQIPGFIDTCALLHAVETRTSSPVRIDRDPKTFECVSAPGLYPIGEGAGYAGGIVSAAVDGLRAGLALADQLGLCENILNEQREGDKLMYY